LSGVKEYSGDLFDGALKKRFDMREANPAWKEHCFDKEGMPCAYLPACWGGCRMISISKGRTWDTIHCEKKMFDRLGRHELLRWAEVWSM
jgi:radical SAM protein with 4Fe4S-binding SPASM domain